MKMNGQKSQKPTGVRPRSASRKRKARPHAPIWDEILKIAHSIPESDLHKLPTDLAANHDHYLYDFRKVS